MEGHASIESDILTNNGIIYILEIFWWSFYRQSMTMHAKAILGTPQTLAQLKTFYGLSMWRGI